MTASGQYWIGNLSDGDDLTAKISEDRKINNLVVKALEIWSDGDFRLEFYPPEKHPNEHCAFPVGGDYLLKLPSTHEGIGMSGANKIIFRGFGNVRVNFSYEGWRH